MPNYDSETFSPPAAVTLVTVHNLETGDSVSDVRMVLDSGADISGLPAFVVDALGLHEGNQSYEIMAYDNSVRECHTVRADVTFQRGHFKGVYIVLDQDYGVIGRNILNHFVVTLDGPQLEWNAR